MNLTATCLTVFLPPFHFKNKSCIRPVIHPSIYLSIHLSIFLSIYLFINPSIYLSIHLSIYLSIYLDSITLENDTREFKKTSNHWFQLNLNSSTKAFECKNLRNELNPVYRIKYSWVIFCCFRTFKFCIRLSINTQYS